MNNKNKTVMLSLFLCTLLLSMMFVGFVQAQTYAAGVKPGMVFDYALTSHWSSPDLSSSEIPQELLIINYTTHAEVRISSVNNTHVTVADIWYFADETSNLERGAVNLLTGDGYGFVGIIASNLKVGDLIHPSGTDGLKILDTTTRNYGGNVNRATNHVRIYSEDTASGVKGTRDLYFDKETGILVEQIDTTESNKTPVVTSKVTWKLTYVDGVENWVVSDALPTLYILLVVIVVIVAVVIFIVYKKKIAKPKIEN